MLENYYNISNNIYYIIREYMAETRQFALKNILYFRNKQKWNIFLKNTNTSPWLPMLRLLFKFIYELRRPVSKQTFFVIQGVYKWFGSGNHYPCNFYMLLHTSDLMITRRNSFMNTLHNIQLFGTLMHCICKAVPSCS